jgi:hypothetical protein
MKRLALALLLIAALACGGSGGTDPIVPPPDTKGPPPPTNVTSGTFAVTATLQINGCSQTTVWDGTYDVVIDSLSFAMGNWAGKWDPAKASATGESPKDVTHTRYCTATRYSVVYLKFTTRDHFAGSIVYRLRLAGDCGTRSTCTTSWVIRGDRQ